MFSSRTEAGKLLGEKLRKISLENPVVLGITRGGVVVAAEVAKALSAPLYPLVVKKLSSSWNPEFALGAMGPDGTVVGELAQIEEDQIKEKKSEIKEKMQAYGVGDLGKAIENQTAIIVDDGIATGWTLRAGIAYAQGKQPKRVVVAVPVADREIVAQLQKIVSDLIVLDQVDGLGAVGNYYDEFPQVSDEEVKEVIAGV